MACMHYSSVCARQISVHQAYRQAERKSSRPTGAGREVVVAAVGCQRLILRGCEGARQAPRRQPRPRRLQNGMHNRHRNVVL